MPDITGYAYTKEKKYSYIDPETGKIVYSETPLTGFAHTPQPREAEGYAPVSEEQAMRHKAALKQGLEAQGYKEHWMGEPGQEEFLGYVRPQADEMDAIIKQDYELGHLTILRQYTDDMKIARFYKNADPLMYESLARDAETRKVLGLAEIQANLDKSKRMFKQIDQDRRLSLEEGFKAKMGYYQKNPGFTMPQSERTKRPEMPVTEKLSDVERLFRKFRGEGGEDMPEEVVMEKPKTLWEKYKQSPYGVLFRGEKSSVTEAMPSQQMQSAPDMKLDPYWPKLSDDQKQKVLTLRQRNVSVDVIIDALRKEGTIK